MRAIVRQLIVLIDFVPAKDILVRAGTFSRLLPSRFPDSDPSSGEAEQRVGDRMPKLTKRIVDGLRPSPGEDRFVWD